MIELGTGRAVLALSLAAVGLSSGSAKAQGPRAEPVAPTASPSTAAAASGSVVTLKRCLELAERNYPRIQEAIAKARARRHDVDAARYAPYTQFFATGQIGPAPTVRGTSQFSPNTDAALTSDMGIAWQVGVEGMVPLWTFGKLTNVWDAAEANARVGELAVEKERNELKLAVRRAYFGAQAAQDGIVIVTEAMRGIDRYLPGLDAKVKSGDADEIDLLKLRMQRAEYEARESEGLKIRANALAGLRFLTGLTGAIAVSSEPLVRSRHELGPLTRYLQAARLNRPEVNMVRAGILAQEARVRLERARYFPDFGIGITARWARATERTDQRNPYASDGSNQLGYGAAFVMNYKLDFLPQIARVAGAEAELEAMRASERYALGGVGIEVEEAFREAEDAKRRLDAWSRATELAERWLSQVERRIEVGTFSEKELFDPTRELAFKRFGKLSAIFEYNVALARLALATGWEQGMTDY
jgi:outer membrane protein TolC